MSLTRRRLLSLLASTLASATSLAAEPSAEGDLELTALHSGETVRFRVRGVSAQEPDTLKRIEHVLRDRRSGDTHAMDPALFVQLVRLAAAAGVTAHYDIISAYRSPETNAKLHERSNGVSSKSLHMEGRAMDVRLRGVETLRLATLAREMAAGGVGCYLGERFVHIDTGRIRTWDG
ncbi:MAG: DUF882 domain-containing protein [Steroidobacteraceae bacterium]